MIPERIAEKFSVDPSGCWLWSATITGKGSGQVQFEGKRQKAHRVLYQILRGPIPEGLTLDHLCRNRACVNPWHCEAVPLGVNLLRGIGFAAINAAKTHCKKGHEFTPQNTYRSKVGRECRICRAANRPAWRRARVKP